MDTNSTQPRMQWVMVADGSGRRHLEARWTTGRPAHTTAQAA